MANLSRGSEWRKWDLHIHTPASFYWVGTKKYGEMSQEEKNAEMKSFIETINNCDAEVFCLMDYWTFDWYIELQNYITINPNELKKTIFPGMELRIESPTSYRLNIHFILSDRLTKQQLVDFKSELIIRSINRKLSDDALIQFAKTLDESKAKIHGYTDPASLSEDKLLELGSKTAEISKESLKEAFNHIPKDTGYIILPYDTSDGLLKLDWTKHPHADNYFMQSANIFESRDQINIDLINGVKTAGNESFFENFFKTLGNTSKPCVSGSDAHKYTDYAKFPSNKNTWIKSEPTFEGLKQIIYEPQQRVKIQESEPDYKDDKLIIDEIRFISPDKTFTDQPIRFNKNLNVIIGGKSSGKSILLYNIAKTLLSNRNILKIKNPDTNLIEYKYDFGSDFDFIVKIASGNTQSIKRDDSEPSILSEIKYIPQNHLSELAERKYKNDNELTKLVRSLLLEDEIYDAIYKSFIDKVKFNDEKRESLINNYFNIKDKVNSLVTDLGTKGSEEVLTTNVSSNTEKVNKLKENAGLSEERIAEYNKLNDELGTVNISMTKIRNDYNRILTFNNELKNSLSEIISRKQLSLNSLEVPEIKAFFADEYSSIDEVLAKANEISEMLRVNEESRLINNSIIREHLKIKQDRKIVLEKQLEPFVQNQEVKKQIELLEKSITEDKQKLSLIAQVKNEIANNKQALELEFNKIFDLYAENYNEYEKVINDISKRAKLLEDINLKIESKARFNFPKLRNKIFEISDGRSASYRSIDLFNSSKTATSDFEISNQIQELKSIFNSIAVTGEYVLNTSTTKKNAIKILLDDYFFDFWEVIYDKDTLDKMSTGKASFVILMLIVGLSKSKAPILIDQPEDNLDNRSITKDLVKYLKEKKIERQIILVTHNPNIVVNADSENVIVANQQGQNDTVTSSVFRFDYVNGAIENTRQKDESETDLLKSMGIREHIADIVEGGEEAFKKREEKYGF